MNLGGLTVLRAVLSQEKKKKENQLKGSQSNLSVTDDKNFDWDICENCHAEPEGDNLLSDSNRRVPIISFPKPPTSCSTCFMECEGHDIRTCANSLMQCVAKALFHN